MTGTKDSSLMMREMCLILNSFSRGGILERQFRGHENKYYECISGWQYFCFITLLMDKEKRAMCDIRNQVSNLFHNILTLEIAWAIRKWRDTCKPAVHRTIAQQAGKPP